MDKSKIENKCAHPGYVVKGGALVCMGCGAPSPRAALVDGKLVKVQQSCPNCGQVETKDRKR